MMSTIYTVVDNVLQDLNIHNFIHVEISSEPDFYILEFQHTQIPDTYLKVEVPKHPEGNSFACVLKRKNVGRRTMIRIMDSLVHHLIQE